MADAETYKETSTTYFMPSEALDKIALFFCQLLCFPNYIAFVRPFVDSIQVLQFKEESAIKIFHIDYLDFLHFLHQCTQILKTLETTKPEKDLVHLVEIAKVQLKFAYSTTIDEASINISEGSTTFNFPKRLIPHLISGIGRILFKSYSYTHNMNFLVRQYVAKASIELLQKPTYDEAYKLFLQLEANYPDYFLLFDIISRHKKVLVYLKRFAIFDDS